MRAFVWVGGWEGEGESPGVVGAMSFEDAIKVRCFV